MSALDDLKKLLIQAKTGNFEVEPEVEEIQEEVAPEVSAIEQLKALLREAAPKYVSKEVFEEKLEEEVKNLSQTDIIQMTADLLGKKNTIAEANNIEAQRWNDPLRNTNFVTQKQMTDHYNLLLSRIQTQLSSLGGGGEVNFRYLDDVNRATMSSSNDNFLLEYDASSKKVQFTDKIGPIDHIHFNLNHIHEEERLVGTLCWSDDDKTLNITHPGGVTQQVGQETYAYVRNGTANTILDGTVCMFTGSAIPNGEARLLVSPAISNGTFPSLYTLGVATQSFEPGEDGRVTVWGKVRGLNTSSYDVGNILYSNPAVPGGFTNIKPTAPNNVVPIGVVLRKDAVYGEIFVRPIIDQRMYYGRFTRATDQNASAINQAIPVVFDTVEIANGITFNVGAGTQVIVSESGFYQFDLSIQVTATSNKGKVYFWFRKNGIDIPRSTRSTTITNGDTFNVSTAVSLSLNANDYVEIMWAITAIGIFLDAVPATAFCPTASAVILNITQTQL